MKHWEVHASTGFFLCTLIMCMRYTDFGLFFHPFLMTCNKWDLSIQASDVSDAKIHVQPEANSPTSWALCAGFLEAVSGCGARRVISVRLSQSDNNRSLSVTKMNTFNCLVHVVACGVISCIVLKSTIISLVMTCFCPHMSAQDNTGIILQE